MRALASAVGAALVALAAAGCFTGTGAGVPAPPAVQTAVARPVPAELLEGERLFAQHCAACHGEKALGTSKGPPLLSPIYLPNHHSDAAFLAAVQRGVVPHHFNFGPMPPIPGVSADEVAAITRYIRWLQREAGIQPGGWP
ncbi:MAG: cytochrome c [Chloroflexota bacterium]|nr:cytochrome c [Dehalococcoidia bacterium]MDW8253193.1 cytochrome c [Chloroflexota bacterium]